MFRHLKRLSAFSALTFREPLQERILFWLNPLAGYVGFAVMVSVWRVAYAGRPSVAGLSLDQVLTYHVARSLFGGIAVPNARFAHDLWSGNVAVRYLRPVPLFGQYIAETLGRLAFSQLLGVPMMLLLTWLLRVDPRPRGSIVVFALSLVLATLLGYSVELIIGAAMVLFEQNAWAADWMRGVMLGALSGAWIPLAFLPWNLGRYVGWLPFASMVSTPLRIYIGNGGAELLMPQLMWAAACWPFASWVWRRNRQRVVLYGG